MLFQKHTHTHTQTHTHTFSLLFSGKKYPFVPKNKQTKKTTQQQTPPAPPQNFTKGFLKKEDKQG